MNGTKEIPAPLKGPGLLFFLFKLFTNTINALLEISKQYDGIVKISFGSDALVLVTGPEFIKHILKTNYTNYPRGRTLDDLKPLLGNGIFPAEHETWLTLRKILTNVFNKQSVENSKEPVLKFTGETIEKWNKFEITHKPVDLENELKLLLLNIKTGYLLSDDAEFDRQKMLNDQKKLFLTVSLKGHSKYLLYTLLGKSKNKFDYYPKEVLNAFKYITGTSEMILDKCLDGSYAPGILVSALMEEYKKGTITKEQAVWEINTIFFAGFDTVAYNLFWTIYLLCENPGKYDKLMNSLNENEDLSNTYLEYVLKESLRLYPPAWALHREVLQDDVIEGYRIPANSWLFLSPMLTHRNYDYWDRADDFIPERWKNETLKDSERYDYYPFGHGPHTCIGNRMGMYEAKLILPKLLRSFKFNLPSGYKLSLAEAIVVYPKNKINFKINKTDG